MKFSSFFLLSCVTKAIVEEKSITLDVVFNSSKTWFLLDQVDFTLPFNGGRQKVKGIVEYVEMFDEHTTFISGFMHSIKGIPDTEGTFSVSYYKQQMNANIQYPGNVQYELRPAPHTSVGFTKKYVMTKVNITEKYVSKEKLGTDIINLVSMNLVQPLSLDTHFFTPIKLRILIIYTLQAVASIGGEDSMKATIALAIGNFNVALKNSQLNVHVEFVAEPIQEYDTYVEDTDIFVMLSQMGSAISTVRRNLLGCHAVHLVTSNAMFCAVGHYELNGLTTGYSASYYGCISGYMSLAHVVSHNIGLQHDISAYAGGSFNRGYCWDDNTDTNRNCRRSIMAHASCITPKGKGNCDYVKYFSTPHVYDMGSPVGVSAQFDNVQQLKNNIGRFISQFSLQLSSTSPRSSPLNTIFPTKMPSSSLVTSIPQLSSSEPTNAPTVRPTNVSVLSSVQPIPNSSNTYTTTLPQPSISSSILSTNPIHRDPQHATPMQPSSVPSIANTLQRIPDVEKSNVSFSTASASAAMSMSVDFLFYVTAKLIALGVMCIIVGYVTYKVYRSHILDPVFNIFTAFRVADNISADVKDTYKRLSTKEVDVDSNFGERKLSNPGRLGGISTEFKPHFSEADEEELDSFYEGDNDDYAKKQQTSYSSGRPTDGMKPMSTATHTARKC